MFALRHIAKGGERFHWGTILWTVCCWACCSSVWAQLPNPPKVSVVHPLGIQPGAATELRFSGQQLAGAGNVWASSLPATSTPAMGQSAESASCRLMLPADTPLGMMGVRYYNNSGVSNQRLLLVDDLPALAVTGQPRSTTTAQPIQLPVAVEGYCEREAGCYFKFTADADERVSIEVYARRLASPLDPILRVLSADGEELAYRDDQPGLMGDCRLSFQAPLAGEYFLEVRDVRYAGGPEYRFRIRMGNFPLASVVFPPVLKRGTASEVMACETEGPAALPVRVEIPASYAGERWAFGIPGSADGRGGSALVHVLASDLEQALEREPNDAQEQATEVTLPVGISGRFQQPRDQDWYTFVATEGTQLSVQALAESFGSAAEVRLELYSEAGALLTKSNPSGTGSTNVQIALPAAGKYRLRVEDLHPQGGEAYVYHLRLEAKTAGYALTVDQDRVNPPQQGICSLKVSAKRTHYAGPISIGLRNAPAGTQLSENIIATGVNETTLKIRLPKECEAGSLFLTEVFGTSNQKDDSLQVVALNAAVQLKELQWAATIPGEFTRELALGVGPVFPPFLKLSLEPAECLLPRLVGTAAWMVKAERLHNFSDAIAIQLKGLPPGMTATGTTIDKGRNDTTIMLAGGEALPEGVTPIELVAEATLQDQPQTILLSGTLRVIPPLQVSLAMAGSLSPEGKQKLTITAQRFGKESNPISIVLQNLPEGVTAPAEIVVPAGVNTLEIELSAALTTQPGKIENLAAQAKTKFQEQDVQAVSPFAALEIVDGK